MNLITEFVYWSLDHPIYFFIILFVEYVVLMETWAHTKGTSLEPYVKHIGGIIFLPQDWWMNIMISVIFLDLPASLNELVTGRMKRYKKTYSIERHWNMTRIKRWRLWFAKKLCYHLNKHDQDHC